MYVVHMLNNCLCTVFVAPIYGNITTLLLIFYMNILQVRLMMIEQN